MDLDTGRKRGRCEEGGLFVGEAGETVVDEKETKGRKCYLSV